MIYSCPPTTPKPSLRSQAGMCSMKHRIWIEKMCVVSSILHTRKDEENYAREILTEQNAMGREGLTKEVEEICQLAGLPDACIHPLGRKEIEEAVVLHHLKEIREEMKPLSKMDKI